MITEEENNDKQVLNITFSSESQRNLFNILTDKPARTCLIRGGSGSGKTWVSMLSVFFRALIYPNSEHYILKTDKSVAKAAFERSVVAFLRKSCFKESFDRKNNKTWFFDQLRSELILANGSIIYIRPIRSPRPEGSRGDSSLLGMNAETIYLDESTTIGFEWYKFLETRARSAHNCPPLILLTENPDARSWTHQYFDLQKDPESYEKLSDLQIEQSAVYRLEAWENKLQDKLYLNILKNSGNADRFFYGVVKDLPDFSKIYVYDTVDFSARFFYVYAIDPGYNAHTGCVMLGFGGDYSVEVQELEYAQGYSHQQFLELVQKIIDIHKDIYNQIKEKLTGGQILRLRRLQLIPHVIIDCARVDLIKDIDLFFNYEKINGVKIKKEKVVVIPSLKGEQKYYSLERVKKLKLSISKTSKNLLKELSNYKYDFSKEKSIPDGNDDLCDAMLYAQRYALEEILEKYPNTLIFDIESQQIDNKIKDINPLRKLK